MTKRNGLAPVAIVLLVALGFLVLLGGAWYFTARSGNPPVTAPTGSNPPASSTPPVATTTPTATTPTSTPQPQPTGSLKLVPASGPVGTLVTVYGSGFAPTDRVLMNGFVGASVRNVSPDGTMLSFTVPETLGPDCQPGRACPDFLLHAGPGDYKISVVLNNVALGVGMFTITGPGID